MNLFRDNPELKAYRDGVDVFDCIHFIGDWYSAEKLHKRGDVPTGAVFKHPDNPQLFISPHAYEYFKGILSTEMPENSKTNRIVVVTDLDARLWHYNQSGAPYHAFREVIDELFDPDDEELSIIKSAELWGFFERSFVRNMRNIPKALFYNEEYSTALVVLSAMYNPTYHFRRMSGIGCLPDMAGDIGEIHDAMMRHEWYHLDKDLHLTDVQIEIGADKVALNGIKTPSLREAWIHARIVGGFMWPFPGRQNGIALIDPKFSRKANQEMQMMVVDDWCNSVFEEFFDPEVAAQLVSDLYNGQTIDRTSLNEDMQKYIEDRFYNKLFNTRKQIPSAAAFKEWFMSGEDQVMSKDTWDYFIRSFMMRLQLSNKDNPEFYSAMYNLSEAISPQESKSETIKAKVHSYFRNSLRALLPKSETLSVSFQPEWKHTNLPNIIPSMQGGPLWD